MVLSASPRPIYLALFSLTLLAVIAGSGALMAIAGKGHDVLVFSMGVGTGMTLVSALSLELWQLLKSYLVAMQTDILSAITLTQIGEIDPRLLLSQYAPPLTTPQNASDIILEIECRRLLDRTQQLLAKAITDDGCCRYCERWGEHDRDCPVPATQQLYESGKAKRSPWREYKKTLPTNVN